MPDYVLSLVKGNETKTIYIEAKGYFRPEDRTKLLAVKRSNPGIDIRLVFFADRKIGKKLKCSSWCKRHGFEWTVGNFIPEEWLQQQ